MIGVVVTTTSQRTSCIVKTTFFKFCILLITYSKLEKMYSALLNVLHLRDIIIDEFWPYHHFKKYVREQCFEVGEFRRLGCYARGCRLCQSDPPDENGDGRC